MKKLSDNLVNFFYSQGCVIVSSIDKDGFPHSTCKGIVDINRRGRIYVLDLYRGKTYNNLRRNKKIAITAIDEHKFSGYCLKGKAKIISDIKLYPQIIKAWEDRVTSRLTQRVLRNLRGEKGHSRHPEVLLPKPEYIIEMKVEEVVDLPRANLK